MPTCLKSRPSITGKGVLACLCTTPDRVGDAGLEKLSGHEWDLLVEESVRHGIASLLYHRLRTFHPDISIPANVIERLRQAYLANSARNMGLYHRLVKVLEALQGAGISVILLKGVHLANVAYRNIALRQMNDIDLLVKKTDLSRVHHIMVKQGYSVSKEEICTSPCHLPGYMADGSPLIEMHFNIMGPPISSKIDLEKLWSRAKKITIEGIDALVLCPDDLLLHVCGHFGFYHGFEGGIRPLLDISNIVEHYERELDWEVVLKRSEEWGMAKCVFLVLSLAKKLTDAPIPERVVNKLDFYTDGSASLMQAEEFIFGKGGAIATNLTRLFDDKKLSDKLKHLMRYVFPPKDMMANMSPLAKSPLTFYSLYFFRIKGLLKRHGQTAWRLLMRDKELSNSAEVENRRNALRDWMVETK